MITISKITIAKPVTDVWRFFDNPDMMQWWLTGFKKFEPVSGIPGRPGAISKHFYEINGKTVEMTEEITVRKEYRELSGIIKNRWMVSRVTTTFRDVGDGHTEMTATVQSAFIPFLLKLFGPLTMKSGFQKRQDDDFRRFKLAVEEGGGDTARTKLS